MLSKRLAPRRCPKNPLHYVFRDIGVTQFPYVSELARYYHRSPERISYQEVAETASQTAQTLPAALRLRRTESLRKPTRSPGKCVSSSDLQHEVGRRAIAT